MIRKEKNSLHILTKTKFYLVVLFFLFYKEKYIINSIDIRGEVVMNINKEKLAIEDSILDIYQQENQNDTFGCVMYKKNSIYKVYLYVERSNKVTSNPFLKEILLNGQKKANVYFNKLEELVDLKDLFKILSYVAKGSV